MCNNERKTGKLLILRSFYIDFELKYNNGQD